MKLLLSLIFLFYTNILANNLNLDSINLTKINKSIQKEEAIAKAYKQYLIERGSIPNIKNLKDNNYLPSSFSNINPFGKTTSILGNKIQNEIPTSLNTNIKNAYYLGENRVYTNAIEEVEITLNTFEKFIYDNHTKITITKTDAKDKYFLNKGVLHYYDENNNYMFSINDKVLILSKDMKLFDENGKINSLLNGHNLLYSGERIFKLNSDESKVLEFLYLGNTILAKSKSIIKESNILQLEGKVAIINDDIYAWGESPKLGFTETNDCFKENSTNCKRVNIPVRLRSKIYDDDIDRLNSEKSINSNVNSTNLATSINNNSYFSTIYRPKFTDAFSFENTTCAISQGALYCLGFKKLLIGANTDTTSKKILTKSAYFDGSNNAKSLVKVVSKNNRWYFLSKDGFLYEIEDNSAVNIDTLFENSKVTLNSVVLKNIKDIKSRKIDANKLALDAQGKIYWLNANNTATLLEKDTNDLALDIIEEIYTGDDRYLAKSKTKLYSILIISNELSVVHSKNIIDAQKTAKTFGKKDNSIFWISEDFKLYKDTNLYTSTSLLNINDIKIYSNGMCVTSCTIKKDEDNNIIGCKYPYKLYCEGDIQKLFPKVFIGKSEDIITKTENTSSTTEFNEIDGFNYNFKLK